MFRNASSRALVSAATISALTLAATTAPHAQAQEVPAEHETLKPEVPVDSSPAAEDAEVGAEQTQDEGEPLGYFDKGLLAARTHKASLLQARLSRT